MTHVHLPLTPEWVLWPQPWVWALLLLVLLPALWWLWHRREWRPAIRFSSLRLMKSAEAGGSGTHARRTDDQPATNGAAAGAAGERGGPRWAQRAWGGPKGAQRASGGPKGAQRASGGPKGAQRASGGPKGAQRASGGPKGAQRAWGGPTWARRVRGILPVLKLAALACLIVAVARPQRPDESSQVYAEGIAIQMVLDRSSSMSDRDLSPRGREMTRLDVVKDVFRRFVVGDGRLPGRPNDLIGMIRFAMYADSVCPLTLDHKTLLDIMAETELVQRRDEDATAIGDALGLAVERLKNVKRTSGSGQQYTITSRVIILLTDGEQNFGAITPEQAGELAATYGIKVYTILAGTGKNEIFYRRPVDDGPLKRVAELTGGKYFHATNGEALMKVYEEIDGLERTKTEERRFVYWGELARPWLLAAFAFLSMQMLLDATWLRKIP